MWTQIKIALTIIDWLIKGYTKYERDKKIAKIRKDPIGALDDKFGMVSSDDSNVPSERTLAELRDNKE